MDQFMVDVTDIPDVKIGDEVTLIGRDGDEVITMEEVGSLSGRFNYEFVCVLGKRIPRVFYRDGKRIAVLSRVGSARFLLYRMMLETDTVLRSFVQQSLPR